MSNPIVGLLIFFSIFLAPNTRADEEGPYVEIISVSGTAEVLISPSQDWVEAKEDMMMRSGDSVKTSEGSYVELAFDEDKAVKVNPNSNCVVLLREDEKIELLSGEVYATIKNLETGSSFEIRTPLGVSGARGTDWLTKLEGSDLVVEAYEDSPFVRHIDPDGSLAKEETRILPGYQTRIAKFQRPSMPTIIPPERTMRWRAWKDELRPRMNNAIMKRDQMGRKLGGDMAALRKRPGRPGHDKLEPDRSKESRGYGRLGELKKEGAGFNEPKAERSNDNRSVNKSVGRPVSRPAPVRR